MFLTYFVHLTKYEMETTQLVVSTHFKQLYASALVPMELAACISAIRPERYTQVLEQHMLPSGWLVFQRTPWIFQLDVADSMFWTGLSAVQILERNETNKKINTYKYNKDNWGLESSYCEMMKGCYAPVKLKMILKMLHNLSLNTWHVVQVFL